MSKKIITISREFGSGGRVIGEAVAKELGYKYYDKDIIAEIAKQTGFDFNFIQRHGELSPQKGLFSYSFIGRDSTGKSIEDMIYEAQYKIITKIADQEPCVIVGRNADYILRERTDVLNVFIHGNEKEKAKRICELYHLSEQDALLKMKEVDKRRSTNYNFYTERIWGMSQNYALSLNSSILGYDKCIKIVCKTAKEYL